MKLRPRGAEPGHWPLPSWHMRPGPEQLALMAATSFQKLALHVHIAITPSLLGVNQLPCYEGFKEAGDLKSPCRRCPNIQGTHLLTSFWKLKMLEVPQYLKTLKCHNKPLGWWLPQFWTTAHYSEDSGSESQEEKWDLPEVFVLTNLLDDTDASWSWRTIVPEKSSETTF